MKTVTGKLVSTKAITLSNAAKCISRFTSSDNGASNAVGIYLQRATDSFSGLVAFHKKLKGEKAHSRRQGQSIDADTKVVCAPGENPQGEKVKQRERKGEVNKSEDLAEKNDGLEVRNGDIVKREKSLDGVVEKKRKKKNKVVDGVGDEGDLGMKDDKEEEKVKKRERKGEVNKSEDLAEKNDGLVVKNEPSPGGVVEKKRKKMKKVLDRGHLGMKDDKKEEEKKGGVEGAERKKRKHREVVDGEDSKKKKKVVDGVGDEGDLGIKDDKKEEKKKGGVEGVEKKKRKHSEVVDGEDSKNLYMADDQSGKRKKKKRKIEGDGKL